MSWADSTGVLGAVFAALCCMGAPIIVGMLGAIGLGWLRQDTGVVFVHGPAGAPAHLRRRARPRRRYRVEHRGAPGASRRHRPGLTWGVRSARSVVSVHSVPQNARKRRKQRNEQQTLVGVADVQSPVSSLPPVPCIQLQMAACVAEVPRALIACLPVRSPPARQVTRPAASPPRTASSPRPPSPRR